MGDNFILTKNVDWSFLNQGFAIPVAMQEILSLYLSDGELRHGEKRKIVLVFNNESHIATLASVDFNQNKYPEHKDIWRIYNEPINLDRKKLENKSGFRYNKANKEGPHETQSAYT